MKKLALTMSTIMFFFSTTTFAKYLAIDFSTTPYPYVLSKKTEKLCQQYPDRCPEIKLDVVKTNYAWIDKELNRLVNNQIQDESGKNNNINEDIESFLKDATDEMTERSVAYNWTRQIKLLASSNRIIQFSAEGYIYTGGAHGLPQEAFYNFDIKNKKLLMLDDIVVSSEAKKQLEQKLHDKFKDYISSTTGSEYKMSAQEWAEFESYWSFFMTENFAFDKDGLTFSYDPYEIAPYAMGFVVLKLSNKELSGLIKREYLNKTFAVYDEALKPAKK